MLKILIALFFGIVCGLLGAYAGADGTSKAIRRLGIPIMLTVTAFIVLENLIVILILNLIWVYSLGYGMPDNDNGSTLGSFWYYVVGEQEYVANILTRATIGLAKICGLIIIPIITCNWALAIHCFIIVILNTIIHGAIIKNGGMFKIFSKDCLREEYHRYFMDGYIALLLILF